MKGLDSNNTTIRDFGVFATYTGKESWQTSGESTKPGYLYNQLVCRNKNNNSWTDWSYSPVIYWPKENEKISFFAYSPFTSQANKITVSDKSKTGMPTLSYRVPDDIKKHIDLLFTLPILDVEKKNLSSNVLPLSFKHALSKISFKARLNSSVIIKPGTS
ncbi:MAG: fimbrillin family protein, partial [Bacteroidales bacterium]